MTFKPPSAPPGGSTNITTVGTITTGVWNGTKIDLNNYVSGVLPIANGGTGLASWAPVSATTGTDTAYTIKSTDATNLLTLGSSAGTTITVPASGMVNGQIIVGINGANALTFSVKTLAGDNPSSGSPVIFNIGSSSYSVTSVMQGGGTGGAIAYSNTTQWLAMTSGTPYTMNIYSCYSSTGGDTGLFILMSRVSNATKFSDFVFNGTNANGAMGFSHTAQANDKVVKLASFSVTLTLISTTWTWNNAGALTNYYYNFPVGTQIDFFQTGSGTCTFATASDPIYSKGSKLNITGQYSGATLRKLTSSSWALIGDLS